MTSREVSVASSARLSHAASVTVVKLVSVGIALSLPVENGSYGTPDTAGTKDEKHSVRRE